MARMRVQICECTVCRLLREVGFVLGIDANRLPVPTHGESEPIANFDERLRRGVNVKRSYERDLTTFDPETDEYKQQRGMVDGMQMIINIIAHDSHVVVDDPPMPKKRQMPKLLEDVALEPGSRIIMTGQKNVKDNGVWEVARPNDDIPTPFAKAGAAILHAMSQISGSNITPPWWLDDIAIVSVYHVTSRYFTDAISSLKTRGLITGSKSIGFRLTPEGTKLVADPHPKMPRGDQLVEQWCTRLSKVEGLVLRAIVSASRRNQAAILKADIAKATGYAATSRYFTDAFSSLRSTRLIRKENRDRAAGILQ